MSEQSTFESDLADWSGSRIEVSSADEELVRALLLDSLAVMGTGIEARPSPALARSSLAAAPGRSIVVGTSETASPAAAALRNATAGAAELWDDTSLWMNTHSSVPIFAALMSAATDLDVSLADLIEAYVVGLEVQMAVRAVCGHGMYLRGYHSTGLLGPIGAGIAVGHLRGYAPELMGRILGIATSMGSGTRAQFGSDAMPFHSGQAAVRGLEAADLAESGLVPDRHPVVGRYGFAQCYSPEPEAPEHWAGPLGLAAADVVLKRFPVGAPNMAPVDAAIRLREQLGTEVELSRIRSIVCRADRWVEYTIGMGMPVAPYAGRVNLPFCVISALSHGSSIRMAFLGDDPITGDTRRLIDNFTVEIDDLRDGLDQPSSEVRIVTDDGEYSARSSDSTYLRPELDGPSGSGIRQKVRDVPAFAASASALIDLVTAGSAQAPIRSLMQLITTG